MKYNVKKMNCYFKNAVQNDLDYILSNAAFTERQEKVFQMYYIKRNDANYIADTIGISVSVIYRELKNIRSKVYKLLK